MACTVGTGHSRTCLVSGEAPVRIEGHAKEGESEEHPAISAGESQGTVLDGDMEAV